MAYTLAPWIGPPESITKSFATGLGIASDIANQRAKMDEDAAAQQLWANLERQKQAQQAFYQQQGLAQDAQRLAMEQQAQQMKSQEAQQQFDSIQRYRSDIASGMDPVQAAFRNLPGSGDSLAGIGALARQLQLSKAYAQPLPPPSEMINPATGQKIGGYYTRGTEGEPEWTPFTSAKMDPVQMLIMRDEMRGYDDKVTRAENALKDLEKKAFTDDEIKAALGSLRAGQPSDRALATVKAYRRELEDSRKAIADAERDRRAYRQSLGEQPTAQVAPPGAAAPPTSAAPPPAAAAPAAGTNAPAPPGGTNVFDYDPRTRRIVPTTPQGPPTQAPTNPPNSGAYGVMIPPNINTNMGNAPQTAPGPGAPFLARQPEVQPPTNIPFGPTPELGVGNRDQAYNGLVKRLDNLSDSDLAKAWNRINPDRKVRYEDGTFYGINFDRNRVFGRVFKNTYQGSRDDMISELAVSALDKGVSPID